MPRTPAPTPRPANDHRGAGWVLDVFENQTAKAAPRPERAKPKPAVPR